MRADVLVFGAHPDDADLGVGGMLHKFAQAGHRVAIADCTRGELASRGTPEEREKEAAEAARILGVSDRVNLALPDGGLADAAAQRQAVVTAIRRFRPRIILAPMTPDRHPDHEAAHALVRSAHFLSGVQKFPSEEEPFRADRLYFYHAYYEADDMPALIVDVTDHFAVKREALQAYRSQFWNPDYDGAETLVSSERFWHNIEHRAARLGARIGATYGEAVFSLDPVGVQILPGL